MADNAFGRGNENPKFTIKTPGGDFFFSPGVSDSNSRSASQSIFQGHHINPNNIVDRLYDAERPVDAAENIIARLFTGLKSIGRYGDSALNY